VAGRIVQHQPARTRPLDEVKAQAREALLAQRAAEAARKEGNDKLAAWKAAPAQAALPAATTVSRQMPGGLPPKVIEAALRADPSALPGWVGVDLGNEGFAVVRVNKVLPREAAGAADPVAQQLRAQYQQAWTGAEAQAYYNLLKERYKVRIKVSQPKEEAAPKL
jgi:peptidyl-prolyl cis-trans isomerase D